MRGLGLLLCIALLFMTPLSRAGDQTSEKYFDDPFMQITYAVASCPNQERTKRTAAEMRAEIHWRAERGSSCYLRGRCRLPNSYMYDREIAARVKKTILADSRLWNSSVWMEGYRRWVALKGCATSPEQRDQIERAVRMIDDVEAVINEISVISP